MPSAHRELPAAGRRSLRFPADNTRRAGPHSSTVQSATQPSKTGECSTSWGDAKSWPAWARNRRGNATSANGVFVERRPRRLAEQWPMSRRPIPRAKDLHFAALASLQRQPSSMRIGSYVRHAACCARSKPPSRCFNYAEGLRTSARFDRNHQPSIDSFCAWSLPLNRATSRHQSSARPYKTRPTKRANTWRRLFFVHPSKPSAEGACRLWTASARRQPAHPAELMARPRIENLVDRGHRRDRWCWAH